MLEYLLGSRNVEKILFYLLVNERGYAADLARKFNVPLFSVQKILQKLERGGVLVSFLEGKTRIYIFNPRYALRCELIAFLQKAYDSIPGDVKENLYAPIVRKRPRRTGKPLSF